MHICYLNSPIEYYSPVCGGAVATVIREQAEELLRRGHQISVLTIVNEQPVYRTGDVVPIRSGCLEKWGWVRRKYSGLMRRVRRWDWPRYECYRDSFCQALKAMAPRPDVVVVHNDWISGKYIKRVLPGVKVIHYLHNEQRSHQSVRRNAEAIDQIVTVSDYIRKWMMENYRLPEEKSACILNGVDLGQFFPAEDFDRLGGELRVLCIGRIDPNKGPDIAADAVAELRGRGVAIRLTVAGGLWWYGHGQEMNDPYFRTLKAKMDAAGAEYLGHITRDRVAEVYRQHDVVCTLSRSNEPFGLVALEAMASGCAVVSSNRGGLPEACGGAAMLVDPDDYSSVVNCLYCLATDVRLLAEQKRWAVERAATGAWAMNAKAMEEVMFSIVSNENDFREMSTAGRQPALMR